MPAACTGAANGSHKTPTSSSAAPRRNHNRASAISGISNAKPAKATTLTLPQNGDIVLLKSNWTELNDLGAYAEDAAGGTFSLAGVDTTNTGLYPPGEGAGSYQVAGSFISLSQIRGVEHVHMVYEAVL